MSDLEENSLKKRYIINALNGIKDNFVCGKNTDFDDSKSKSDLKESDSKCEESD